MKKRFSGPPVSRPGGKPKRRLKPAVTDTSKPALKPTPSAADAPKKPAFILKPTVNPSKPKIKLDLPAVKPSKPKIKLTLPASDTAKPKLKINLATSDTSKLEPELKPVVTDVAESESDMPNYVVGRRAAIELLKSDSERGKIEKVYLAHGIQGNSVSEILHFIRVHKIAHTELDRRRFGELERNAGANTDSQGVIILLNATSYWELENLIPEASLNGNVILIALDGIEDPHNIGAIIRSAEALGASGLMLQKRGAVLTPAVYKTSAGAALHLPIVKIGNLAETLSLLKEQYGFHCIGLAGEGEKEIGEVDGSGNICLVIGSEEKGLHQLTRKRCDELVKIPMRGRTESLNASVAAAIAMYQILKQD